MGTHMHADAGTHPGLGPHGARDGPVGRAALREARGPCGHPCGPHACVCCVDHASSPPCPPWEGLGDVLRGNGAGPTCRLGWVRSVAFEPAPGWPPRPRPPRPPGAPSSPSPASSRRPKCASPCSAGVSVKKQEGRRNGLGHLGPRARREGVGGADRAWRGPRSTRPSGAAVRLVPGPLKVPAA